MKVASKEENIGGLLEVGVGCKPFHDKIFGIEIVASSEPIFSPDSEYGVKNVIRPTCSPNMTELNLVNPRKLLRKTRTSSFQFQAGTSSCFLFEIITYIEFVHKKLAGKHYNL